MQVICMRFQSSTSIPMDLCHVSISLSESAPVERVRFLKDNRTAFQVYRQMRRTECIGTRIDTHDPVAIAIRSRR